ncbi:MAG: hypothetical protein JWO88_3654 [Frankiales bacterium]|nr:hypothetical protein [Frankiales bacterium]
MSLGDRRRDAVRARRARTASLTAQIATSPSEMRPSGRDPKAMALQMAPTPTTAVLGAAGSLNTFSMT